MQINKWRDMKTHLELKHTTLKKPHPGNSERTPDRRSPIPNLPSEPLQETVPGFRTWIYQDKGLSFSVSLPKVLVSLHSDLDFSSCSFKILLLSLSLKILIFSWSQHLLVLVCVSVH